MNDEIKEILDYLKDEKWDYYPSDMTPYKVFFMEERDKLLDYITNLQEEINRLNNIIDECIEDISFCLKSIEQEYIMSTDERTRQEMLSCKQILKEKLDKLKEGK